MSKPAPGRIRPPRAKKSSAQTLLVIGLIAAIAAGAGAFVWMGESLRVATGPGPGDRARDVTDLAPYAAVSPAGDAGWVAELPVGWSATHEPSAITSLCERTLARLQPKPGQTLVIVGGEGEPLIECGDGVSPPGGPRANLTAAPTPPASTTPAPATPPVGTPPPGAPAPVAPAGQPPAAAAPN